MSHTSPLAPPPPTARLTNRNDKHLRTIDASNVPSKSVIEKCLWAEELPALQRACYLARVCEFKPPEKCQYYNVTSILQEGPTCGLTALSMLFNGKPTTKELLAEAKERHFSCNGELFSANDLYRLICDKINIMSKGMDIKCDQQVFSCEMHNGILNCEHIKQCLMNGACVLVPYDPDFNHSPCLRNGHKAHWALIIGYLINENSEFYVIARHGKAKNLGVWSLHALSESNANLIEFVQPKGYPNCDFVVPLGGIGGPLGLKERAIIVNVTNYERINVQ